MLLLLIDPIDVVVDCSDLLEVDEVTGRGSDVAGRGSNVARIGRGSGCCWKIIWTKLLEVNEVARR